jgi:O-antigen ligase/polysaccharide polymerase Wzy-like membrane protein
MVRARWSLIPERAAWVSMGVLVAAFLLKAPVPLLWLMAAGVVASGLAIRDPIGAVALIPATALLGPIARVDLPGGLTVHLGDIYLVAVFLSFLAREGGSFPLRFGRNSVLAGLLLLVVLVGWLFSLDVVAAAPTAVGIAELLIVYLVTLYAVRDAIDAEFLIDSWIAAVTLGSVLVIVSYLRGDVLILGAEELARVHASALRSSTTLLFRASFFVTSFIFPLSVGIVLSVAKLMFATTAGRARWLLVASLVINLISVIALGNATAFIALLIGAVSLVLFLPHFPSARRRFLVTSLAGIGVVIALVFAVRSIVSPAQLALILARRSDSSSLQARFFVWHNVVNYLMNSPHALYLGLGPDLSVRLQGDAVLQSIFFGGGLQQAAVDSGYLYVALDYGLIVLSLLLVIGIRSLFLTLASGMKGSLLGVYLSAAIIVWGLMSLTQQHGVAKPVFMIMQVIAFTNLLIRRRSTAVA